MKYLFLFSIFFLLNSRLHAQSNTDSILYLKQGPVNFGYVFRWIEEPFSVRDPGIYISVYSKSAEVSSLREGHVKDIRLIHDKYAILIKTHDSVFVYSNLSKANCKIGDRIRRGQLIALMSKEDKEIVFELEFGILIVSSRKSLNYIDLFEFLEKSQS